jgi:RND family efflux transporter MFP subunit
MRPAAMIGLALAASVAGGCSAKKGAEGGAPPAGKAGRGALVFTVDVMPIEAKEVDYVVTAPGSIDAFERVQVTARVAGAVDHVAFTEGQVVKKGAMLVAIDSERYAVAVNSAKAALEKAQASQKDVEASVARREGASANNPGLIPGEELESYRTKVLTAKADAQVATEALRTAQLNLRDSTVRAPIEGVIQTRTVETGQYVQAGYVMATLLRSDPMLLRFSVEPDEAPRLKPGMTASFTMRETLRGYEAKISLVSGAADPTTHMVPVTAELMEAEHKFWLRPGSFCDVTVKLPGLRVAPMIPRAAARATDHGYVAFVVDGDVAKEKVLNLGMSTKDGWIEVRSGLEAGQLLVVRGAEALSSGAKVRANQVTAASLATGAAPDGGAPAAQPAADASGAPTGGASTGPQRKRRGEGGAPQAARAEGNGAAR